MWLLPGDDIGNDTGNNTGSSSGGSNLSINAGGKAVGDFDADSFHFGGNMYSTKAAIAGTTADSLYQTERYGDFSYKMAVENGVYDVTLKFAEIYWAKAGARVFDVRAEGMVALENYDIFKEAGGKNIAVDETFSVTVKDGMLNLDFLTEIDNAKVSAIDISPADTLL